MKNETFNANFSFVYISKRIKAKYEGHRKVFFYCLTLSKTVTECDTMSRFNGSTVGKLLKPPQYFPIW